ncbi:prepilin-type N-terminal cleavage/methylation domain-containing protein [Persephonella sp.]|uniref:type IV pilus modification PilV family protein n=1 Tax=Persephonella sp. TaxID=2060922 RepID=UPI002614BEF5|nr:prepilin-type N-terminal cleavage/methylation domain-containing protein [Persephonella sp.]
MENWEQMMIYPYGMKTNSGFTLLEVVAAVTIFAIAFTVLIKIQSKHIADLQTQFEKLQALKFFKIKTYKIPGETLTDRFHLKEESKTIDFGIRQIKYTIFDKNQHKILEIKTYEK